MNPVYRKDYVVPDFLIDEVSLVFELDPKKTRVTNTMHCRRNVPSAPFVLHGEKLELLSVRLDNRLLNAAEYTLTETSLTITTVPDHFSVTLETLCDPSANTVLDGLYVSSGNFCTQCEPHGFRKITYYLDRPDVMAKFTTTIIADAQQYPVMLSNGNCILEETLPEGKKKVTWQDPFKKPCYLFALVAGNLECYEDYFMTQSGRKVTLRIFVETGNVSKTHHAMEMLKLAMHWDEENYGREYDLDIFMIVAVSDFNMGAMENKGLNIFNAKYILVDAETATDTDYEGVAQVVAHEYFHNWTGNRITCRDWFQLSLKEGLTVYRDQEFTADLTSRAVTRIDDVRTIKLAQFSEDAGPLAHPVRPDSYIEMNNFYTVTVYHKGAEVVRMLHTFEGDAGFRKGMDLYFERFDGMAVTCDDFVQAHADANRRDYTQFMRWYSQAGTPTLTFSDHFDSVTNKYILTVRQQTKETADESAKLPFELPIKLALFDVAHEKKQDEKVLTLNQAEQHFEFKNFSEKPLPSLMRNFSAPVKWEYPYTLEEQIFLLQHDDDAFNKFEMAQQLFSGYFTGTVTEGFSDYLNALHHVMFDKNMDNGMKAKLLTLPSYRELAEAQEKIQVERTIQRRKDIAVHIAKHLSATAYEMFSRLNQDVLYAFMPEAVGIRALKSVCLQFLWDAKHPEAAVLTERLYFDANNMTDRFNAIALIAYFGDAALLEKALKDFYQANHQNALVMEKWFAIQALVPQVSTLESVKDLMCLPLFDMKNPNKIRALLGTFAQQNFISFHLASGSAYEFLAEQVMALDKINSIIAARLVEPLTRWKRYEDSHAVLMRSALQSLLSKKLSNDLSEIVNKSVS